MTTTIENTKAEQGNGSTGATWTSGSTGKITDGVRIMSRGNAERGARSHNRK